MYVRTAAWSDTFFTFSGYFRLQAILRLKYRNNFTLTLIYTFHPQDRVPNFTKLQQKRDRQRIVRLVVRFFKVLFIRILHSETFVRIGKPVIGDRRWQSTC